MSFQLSLLSTFIIITFVVVVVVHSTIEYSFYLEKFSFNEYSIRSCADEKKNRKEQNVYKFSLECKNK